MARIVKDRVKDTSTTTGTGTITLANSPPNGFQAFSVLGNGSTTFYCIEDANGTAFEVGIGTYTGNTLARTTILESSNSDNAISLTSGTHTAFVTYPSNRSTFNDEGLSPTFTASGTITAGKPVIQNTNGTVEQIYTNTTITNYDPQQATVQKEFSGNSSPSDPSSDYQYFSTYAYDSSTNTILFAHSLESNSYYQYVTPATPQLDGSLVFGTPTIVLSSTIYYCDIAWSDTSKNFLLAFSRADIIYLTVLAGTIGGSDNARTISTGSTVQIENANKKAYGAVVEWNADNDRYFVCQTHYDSPYYIWGYVVSVSGTSATGHNLGGTRIFTSYYTSSSQCKPSMTYDANSSKMVVMGNALTTNASSYSTYITALTIGTSSISSQGTPQQLDSQISSSSVHGGTETCHSVIYDPTGYKLLFGYVKRNSSDPDNRVRLKVGSLSGTTFTFGSHTELSDTGMGVQVGYDGNLNKFSAIRSSRSTSPYSTSFYNLTYNNSLAITLSTEVDCPSDEGWGMYGVNYNLPYISYNRSIYGTQRPISSAGYATNLKYWSFQSKKSVETTNYDASKYFGVASNSATTTNPVQINVPGSINNAQTGLTVDKDYYVTSTGLIKERTTTTTTTNSDISSSSGYEIANVYNYERDISVAYDTVNNKIGILYVSNSQYPTIVIAEESNNALTYGTPVVVNSQTSYNSYEGQKLVYGNGVFVMCYSWEHYPIYLKAGVYSGTNGITLGSQIQPDTGTGFQSNATIGYNPNANKFVYTFPVANTSSINVYLITNNSTTLTTGNSATMTMGYSSNNRVISNLYDPDTNKQVIMTDHLSGDEGRIYQATISGANITVPSTYYAITDEGSEEDGSKALSYDPDNNKWILFKANTGNVLRANVLTASGDTFTSGTVTQISSQYMRWLAPYYDTEQNKTVLVYMKNTSGYYGEIGFVTISGTTPSFTASATTLGNQTAERVLHNASLYNPDTKSGIVVSATPLSNTKATGFVLYYGTTTSTVVNGSVFAGTALSATALELKTFPASTIVGRADGAVTKGRAVIVEADGDFAQVSGTSSSGSVVSPETQQVSTSPATEDKFYIANNGSGTIGVISVSSTAGVQFVLGTDDGTSITWGTPVTVNSNTYFRGVSVYYDPDEDKFICTYIATSSLNEVRSRIISYSGTTATLSTESSAMTKDNATVTMLSSAYDTTNNKGYVCVGKALGRMFTVTVSGTTITQGALSNQFSGAGNSMQFGQMVYDNTNSVGYITYRNEAISDYPYIQTYTVSGDTFTFGTETAIESLAADGFVGVAEGSADGKGVCVAWKRSGTGIKYITPTFSGLAPTVGASATLSGGQVPSASLYWEGAQVVNYNPVSQTFILAYQDTSSNKFDIVTNSGSVSGGTLTFSNFDVVYPTSNSSQYYAMSGPTGKNANNAFIIQQRYNQSPNKIAGSIWGAAYNISTVNLTAENYIGIAQETVSTGEDVKVTIISGVDANQSSLTPAQLYYVQFDGTLSTTAGSPSVVAGLATSATTLLVTRS